MSQIIVLGNYRSGTTLLAKAIRIASGVTGKAHEHPHEERPDVRELNESVLRNAKASWDRPQVVDSESRLLIKKRDRVAKTLKWGFKDPSVMWLEKWWLGALPDARFVGTFRHPAAVTNSLLATFRRGARDRFEELWQKYALRLLELHDQNPFPLINFDSDDYESDLVTLLEGLGLTLDPTLLNVKREEDSGGHMEATEESMSLHSELCKRAIRSASTSEEEGDEHADLFASENNETTGS